MARSSRVRGGPPALPTTFPAPTGAVTAARTSARVAADVPTQRAGRRVRPVGPLGSLVTAGQADAAGCPWCGDASVTRLALALAGAPATFVSCHTCETRGWFAGDGTPLALDAVLGNAARA